MNQTTLLLDGSFEAQLATLPGQAYRLCFYYPATTVSPTINLSAWHMDDSSGVIVLAPAHDVSTGEAIAVADEETIPFSAEWTLIAQAPKLLLLLSGGGSQENVVIQLIPII